MYAHVKRFAPRADPGRLRPAGPGLELPGAGYVTTVPTQSLGLLNGEFANEQAEAFAKRLQKESPNDLGLAGEVTRSA